MRINFTLGNYDVSFSSSVLRPLSSARFIRRESYVHVVWWKFSLCVTNWALEVHPVCAQCGAADVHECPAGDEGLTYCNSCGSVEGGYEYVNLRQYENAPCC